jgi:predicted ATPase with chaperone activity
VTGIIEAPIHVKSNCGCLVVDDFGRQQISTRELLNRWIVPMESGSDFVNLPSGRQISLPFEQLLIFSTNLEPTSLCDEAFLRRIPYKVEVFDPTETQFRNLFKREMSRMNFQVEYGVLDHLIEYHYKRPGRSFRFCHVLDILNQCRDFCEFHRKPNLFSKDICELAVLNYFSGMGNHLNG